MNLQPAAFPYTFTASNGYESWDIDARNSEDALDQAIEDVKENNVPEDSFDQWSWLFNVKIYDEEGDLLESEDVSVDPPEPDCPAGEHEWVSPHELLGGLKENPGVWGNGGGVIIRQVCRHCGIYRITDTWHTCQQTGQIYEAVCYEEADTESEEWLEAMEA